MGDALDEGEFEAYEPEPEGELEDEGPPSIADEGVAAEGAGASKKKRKRGKKKKNPQPQEGEGEGEAAGAVADEADEAAAEDTADEDADAEEGEADGSGDTEKKKKKKKKKKRAKTKPKTTVGADGAAVTSAEGQAALLWERYCELLDISPLDRDKPRFSPSRFVLPAAASENKKKAQGNKGNKGNKGAAAVPDTGITAFLKRTLPSLQELASDKAHRIVGRPLVVIVSPAAVRANDLAKELRVRLPNQRTAKLFAKHLKLKEQADALQREFNALVVGTPNRLSKLLECGALSLGNARLLVLDASFKDTKAFTLLTLPGVAKDVALLMKEHVLPALEGKGKAEALRIAMF